MIRTDAGLSVSRFGELIDVPRRTHTYRLAKHRAGDPAKGPWPAPVVDRIEPIVARYASTRRRGGSPQGVGHRWRSMATMSARNRR